MWHHYYPMSPWRKSLMKYADIHSWSILKRRPWKNFCIAVNFVSTINFSVRLMELTWKFHRVQLLRTFSWECLKIAIGLIQWRSVLFRIFWWYPDRNPLRRFYWNSADDIKPVTPERKVHGGARRWRMIAIPRPKAHKVAKCYITQNDSPKTNVDSAIPWFLQP